MTDFFTHLYTLTCEIPTLFLFTLSLKKVPLLRGAFQLQGVPRAGAEEGGGAGDE